MYKYAFRILSEHREKIELLAYIASDEIRVWTVPFDGVEFLTVECNDLSLIEMSKSFGATVIRGG